MTTHYPSGIDGATVMRNTAAALQKTLNDLLMADHGIITFPRIRSTPEDNG